MGTRTTKRMIFILVACSFYKTICRCITNFSFNAELLINHQNAFHEITLDAFLGRLLSRLSTFTAFKDNNYLSINAFRDLVYFVLIFIEYLFVIEYMDFLGALYDLTKIMRTMLVLHKL